MTNHTPGPWRIMNGKPTKTRGIDVISETANGRIVASCWFSHMDIYKGEPEAKARADARLIAAAPDMLSVLRDIWEEGMQDGLSHDLRNRVEAAIAKAGGAP